MIANIFLIILTVLTLTFIWLLWLRSHLAHSLRTVRESMNLLQTDLSHRRDMVPRLLESYRISEEPTDLWRKVKDDRKFFQKGSTMEKETEFEHTLWSFMKEATTLKTLHFLEAKKDIEDISDSIEREKLKVEESMRAYNEKRKQFPYSLVSGIFGFRNQSI